jgi:putative ABC transport system substrate-binding protein
MRRREFIAGLGSAAAWPLAARGQSLPRQRRLGMLMGVPTGDPAGQAEVAAFVKALAELGWVEGRNIAFTYRWSGSDIALAEMFAKELVASDPDILVARSTPPTMALKSATSTVPIVFVNVAEPMSSGIVPNLVRPGGNITGFVLSNRAICRSGIKRANSRTSDIVSSGTRGLCRPAAFSLCLTCRAVWLPPCQCKTA